MILSALVDRYEETSDVPRGWQKRDASYALEISEDGELRAIVSLGESKGNKPGKLSMKLPTTGKGRSGKKAYETAYFLCDNADFLLGLDAKKFESAQKLHLRLLQNCDSINARAIKAYFERGVQTPPSGDEIKVDAKFNYVFSFNGRRIDYDVGDEGIRQVWNSAVQASFDGSDEVRCLVTGKPDAIIKLHNKVSLRSVTMGGQPLISMNDQTSFRSYGAGTNDPPTYIGQYAAFAYATALNDLLKNNCEYMGDDALLYWAEKGGEAEESLFANANAPPKSDETKDLEYIVKRIKEGEKISEVNFERKFYLLCLSPNAARISVRFFYASNFGNIIKSIAAHYDRLAIDDDGRTPFSLLPAWLILKETTIKGDGKVHPLLRGHLFRSIFTDDKYPDTLYHAILARIRAGDDITKTKAAVVKAVLIKNFEVQEVTKMALNMHTSDKPYVLGRLFAVLESLQYQANKASTIRERFFSSASTSPKLAFPNLLKLSMHHAAKLDSSVFFEKLKSEIMDKLELEDEPFPTILDLEEQGKFILGYYHQRQALFSGKNKEEAVKDEE